MELTPSPSPALSRTELNTLISEQDLEREFSYVNPFLYFQLHIDTGDSSADTAEEKPKEDDFFSTHEQSAALSAVQDDVIPTAAVAVKPAQNGNKVGCESLFYPSKL